MAYSYAVTVATGSTPNVPVPFPYLERADVHVKLDGVLVADEDLSWISPSIVQLPSTPAAGVSIRIYRLTDATELRTVYSTPNVLDHRDWNGVLTQMLYVTQEAFDIGATVTDDLEANLDYINASVAAAAESATNASGSEDGALAAASSAQTSAINAASSEATAFSYIAAVATARDNALAAISAQETTSVAAVVTQQGTSVAAVQSAETTALASVASSVAAADASEAMALEWAENPEDVAVTGNPGKYSAKHWAAKAEEIVGGTPSASAIAFTPAGNLSSTEVQSALVELDSEKASAADVTALTTTVGTKAADADVVHDTGDETIDGVKTFSSIPVAPASDPTTDNQLARKKYVDDGLATKADLTATKTVTISLNYTLQLADAGVYLCPFFDGASTVTVTVPPNSSVAFPIGTKIDIVNHDLNCTIAAGVGVTIVSKDAKLKIDGQYAAATLIKHNTDLWVLIGALKA